jgi:uncharacterized membrane protein YdjX (TVP38/TMEM64 family)
MPWLRHALGWTQLAPALRSGFWVVLLFAGGLWVARHYAQPVQRALEAHAAAGVLVFVASSALAVLLPLVSNLPLVPLAVLVWGPWWTASLLLLGWLIGAVGSFVIARQAGPWMLRRFPAAMRHADIDRLIHPGHRLWSLVALRMTFPVDVLSYALGLFSRSTTASEVALSTLLGAAPFALLFAWFPTLSAVGQAFVFAASTLAFAAHLVWVLRRDPSR